MDGVHTTGAAHQVSDEPMIYYFWRYDIKRPPPLSPQGLNSSLAGIEHVTVWVSLKRWICHGGEWMAYTHLVPHTKFQMNP